MTMTMTKRKKNRKKIKKSGGGEGEICTKCTKHGDKINQLSQEGYTYNENVSSQSLKIDEHWKSVSYQDRE